MDGLAAPSMGTSLVAAAAGEKALVPGPVVRLTRGDWQEIFEGKRHAWAKATVSGIVVAACHLVFDLAELHGILRLAISMASTSLAIFGWDLLPAWQRRRRFSRTRIRDQLGAPVAPASGAAIRLIGTVEACGEPFAAPGTGEPVVFARTLFYEAGFRDRAGEGAREEIRAVPFRIRLGSGATVSIDPAEVRLASPQVWLKNVPIEALRSLGAASRGSVFRPPGLQQATLAAGERVEVLGHLVARVGVDGEAAPVRGSPMVQALVPLADGAVWLRRLKS